MIRTFSTLSFAAAALVLSLAPVSASELRHVGGTCYADGAAGCRPLRKANRVHVTYGPAIPLYRPVDPAFVVDQGPQPVRPSAPYEVGAYDGGYAVAAGYPGYFQYGGGRRDFRRHVRPLPRAAVAVRGHAARPGHSFRASAPRAFMGARAPMAGGRHR